MVISPNSSAIFLSFLRDLHHFRSRLDADSATEDGPADQANRQVEFLLLFDSRTRQMVSDDGVLVVNTPQKGKVGVFEGVSALETGW